MPGVEQFTERKETSSGFEIYLRDQPILLKGVVTKGFGRGGKMLGCPTANIPVDPYLELLSEIPGGIYFGWAALPDCDAAPKGDICKMVMSIGWNPYFENKRKSIEPHLIKTLPDFYDVELRLVVGGFIRLEQNFESLELLVDAIQNDIKVASEALRLDEMSSLQAHDYLKFSNA
mmetsp:Transcript_2166/g.3218  ORF Transcript_2166/g.3218 Transcript_2166/m.3218 type:complete len:175 (-) Transcript_2166:964-1488(-)